MSSRPPPASSGCSSPSRGGSAPASRWRSRRWPGWSAASPPPVYCYHEIVHNQADRRALRAPGRRVRRRHRRGARRVTRSCCRPTARRPPSSPPPSAGQLRRRLGVPAGHEGAPRGAGPGRQGLPHRVRRPRGPRGGRRDDGRRARRDHPGRVRRAMSRRSPTFDEPVALLAQTTLSHRDWDGVAVAVRERFPDVWSPGPQRPVLRHDEPAVGADGAGRPLRRHRDHRFGELVEHRRPREAGARGRAARSSCRVNAADELPADILRDARRRRRHRRGVGARRARRPPSSTASTRPTASRSCGSPTEDEYFPPPRKLRELQAAIGTPATAMLGGSLTGRRRVDDRSLAASDVLAALAG